MEPPSPVTSQRKIGALQYRVAELEAQLGDRERQFRQVLGLNPDAVYIHVDDVIVFANAATIRLFGARSVDDFLGRQATSLVDPSDRARLAEARRQIKARLRTDALVELRYRRLDGSSFESESLGVEITWEGRRANLVTVRDVSDRKRTELMLRQSELRYRSLFDFAPDGIYVHVDDQIVFANPALARLFGYDGPEDLIGKSAMGLVHPDDRNLVRAKRNKIQQDRAPGQSTSPTER